MHTGCLSKREALAPIQVMGWMQTVSGRGSIACIMQEVLESMKSDCPADTVISRAREEKADRTVPASLLLPQKPELGESPRVTVESPSLAVFKIKIGCFPRNYVGELCRCYTGGQARLSQWTLLVRESMTGAGERRNYHLLIPQPPTASKGNRIGPQMF